MQEQALSEAEVETLESLNLHREQFVTRHQGTRERVAHTHTTATPSRTPVCCFGVPVSTQSTHLVGQMYRQSGESWEDVSRRATILEAETIFDRVCPKCAALRFASETSCLGCAASAWAGSKFPPRLHQLCVGDGTQLSHIFRANYMLYRNLFSATSVICRSTLPSKSVLNRVPCVRMDAVQARQQRLEPDYVPPPAWSFDGKRLEIQGVDCRTRLPGVMPLSDASHVKHIQLDALPLVEKIQKRCDHLRSMQVFGGARAPDFESHPYEQLVRLLDKQLEVASDFAHHLREAKKTFEATPEANRENMVLRIVRDAPIPDGYHRGQFELFHDANYTFTMLPNPYANVGSGHQLSLNIPMASGKWEELRVDAPAFEALYFRFVNPEFRLLYDCQQHSFQDYIRSTMCRRYLRRHEDGGIVRLNRSKCGYVCVFAGRDGCKPDGSYQCNACRRFTKAMRRRVGPNVELPAIADMHLFNAGVGFGEYLFTQFARSLVHTLNQVECDRAQRTLRQSTISKAVKRRHDAAVAHAAQHGYALGAMFGKAVTIPRTVEGSPMYYKHYLKAAYSVVAKYGRGYDLFITVVGSKHCNELLQSVTGFTHNSLRDRWSLFYQHDLHARAFASKLRRLENELLEGLLTGEVADLLRSIEYQRLGIPHAHILLMLGRALTVEDIDRVCTVEIPDISTEEGSRLWETMKREGLIHLCDPNVCKGRADQSGVGCTKRCLNEPAERTYITVCGRVVHKCIPRENGGRCCSVKYVGSNKDMQGKEYVVDSRRVMPYNPFLVKRYQMHICVKVMSFNIKPDYSIKYPLKGHGLAHVQATAARGIINQRASLQCAMNVGAEQCAMQTLCRDTRIIRHEHTSVTLNKVFLDPVDATFTFDSEATMNDIDSAMEKRLTANDHATEFFAVNAQSASGDFCRTLRFDEFPYYYVTTQSPWVPRKKQLVRPIHVIPTCFRPSHGDVYYFYLLLCSEHSCGKMSREALRTVEGVLYPTFQEAACALGVVTSALHWDRSLLAHVASGPAALFDIFCGLLFNQFVHNEARHDTTSVTCMEYFFESEGPWQKWWPRMVHGELSTELLLLLEFRRRLVEHSTPPCELSKFLDTLDDWCDALKSANDIDSPHGDEVLDATYYYKKAYWPQSKRERKARLRALRASVACMSESQLCCYNKLRKAISSRVHTRKLRKQAYFMDGAAGAGKSFVINTFIEYCDTHGHIVLVCSSTGVNALNLRHCRTLHGMFSVPIDADAHSRSQIHKGDGMATLISAASALVYDESFVHSKYTLEVVHRCCQDMRDDNTKLFGGLMFLGCGDWRQTLPIADGAKGQEDSVGLCLTNWVHWCELKRLRLVGNMRLLKAMPGLSDDERHRNEAFAQLLMEVGNGEAGRPLMHAKNNSRHVVDLPAELLAESVDSLIADTFIELRAAMHSSADRTQLEDKLTECYSKTSLLALTIKDCANLNARMLADTATLLSERGFTDGRIYSFPARDVECNVRYAGGMNSKVLAQTLGVQVRLPSLNVLIL